MKISFRNTLLKHLPIPLRLLIYLNLLEQGKNIEICSDSYTIWSVKLSNTYECYAFWDEVIDTYQTLANNTDVTSLPELYKKHPAVDIILGVLKDLVLRDKINIYHEKNIMKRLNQIFSVRIHYLKAVIEADKKLLQKQTNT